MSFLYPQLLFLLLLPLLLGVAALVLHSRRQSTWRQLVSEQHEDELVRRRPHWKTSIPALLILLALSLAILALARPINGFEESDETASSRNLLIALDISRSMETQDVRPSRLEEARAAAYEVIDALPSDKIGLIVFSGEADLVVPLTYDHGALKEILSSVKRDWIPTGGTNFGLVLEKAMQDFQRSAPTGSNALLIFSDGEDTVGEGSKELAAKAKENNLLVITVGIGTEAGGAIPDPDAENGYYQDQSGKHVISSLKIPQLQEFAKATGGDFFIMGAGANLAEFAQRAAEKIDRHDDTTSINKVPRDLFVSFLIPALLLMLMGLLLSTDWKNIERRRFSSAPILLLGLLFVAPTTKADESATVGDVIHDLGQQNYGSALARLELIQQQTEGQELNAQLSFAQGIAAMQEGNTTLARDAFSRALLSTDKDLQAAATYQMSKIGSEEHFDKLRGLFINEEGQTQEPSVEDLEAMRPLFEQDIKNFGDALRIKPQMDEAVVAEREMKKFLQALDEEIEKRKQQEQQEQQEQDQNQEQQDEQQQDQDKNQEQQDEQQQDQDKNQDQQDEQQQDQDKNQDQQDEQQQDQDKNQDQQDEQQQDQDQDKNQDLQDEQQQDQDKNQDQQDEQQQEQDQNLEQQEQEAQEEQTQEAQEAPAPKSEEEKQKDKARSILNMNLDEQKGSPIPRINTSVRPPAKDY